MEEAEGGREREQSEREKKRAEAERKAKIEEEVEKVKKRRDEREKEQAWMEEEKARMARESEEAQHNEWESKADEFHLEQARLRAKIRATEGRAKPIDIFAKNLMDDDADVEMTEPYKLFRNLALPALEDLQQDVEQHRGLDHQNAEFWEAMAVVCEDEIHLARVRGERERKGDIDAAAAIEEDISATFVGKSWSELKEQEEEIQSGMQDNVLDPEFAQQVLAQLKTALAKAKLKDIHGAILRKKLAKLEGELAQEAMSYDPKPKEDKGGDDGEAAKKSEWDEPLPEKEDDDDSDDEGGFSPVLDQTYQGDDAEDAEADAKAVEEQRRAILNKESDKFKSAAAKNAAGSSGMDDAMFQQEAGKGMADDEIAFGGEVDIDQQVYTWHDKYRPRKPRFFNRVHTGYEWNKYNQTHYDHDNPPPKIVQGYKFNIFYPDLIDKSKAPTFRLENDKDQDTKIIRFTAGPPYEDIAFRIVNKDWEYSHKRGFKCTFDRGILHLYFNFMRYRYRR
mmetsp:Transcript_31730/g.79868  ORF Transcript_31730/g.79868 Transcript_31730/m.79868 type:complete len:508 (+) Transcript_31730:2-1525(+)